MINQTAHAATLPPSETQIELAKKQIQAIVSAVNEAKDDLSWHEGLPILNERKALAFNMAGTCEALNELPPQDLIIFENDFTQLPPQQLNHCQKSLLDKINAYLKLQESVLAQSYQRLREQKLSRCSERKSNTLGPALDMQIDPKLGGVLTGSKHPHCTITFTFDDGPHRTHTEKLLQILASEDILANFFVVGKQVMANPKVLQSTFEAGHIIGNHSMTHADLRKLSFEKATAEIENGFESITNTLAMHVPFFRFPYGASTKNLRSYLNHFNRVEFFWNMDTRDWAIRDPVELYSYSLDQIEKVQRGIILYHDVQPQTITMMPYLLQALRESGYQVYLITPQTNKLP